MPPGLISLLGPIIVLVIGGLLVAWVGESIDNAIDTSGPAALAVALGGHGFAAALWLWRFVLLVRPSWRWKFRAWILQAAWGYALGWLAWEHWTIWQAEAAHRAELPLGAALASLVALVWGFNHLRTAVGGDTSVERGSRIAEAAAVQREIWGKKHKPDDMLIRLGGLDIPPTVEAKHFMLCGSTGSGKTQAIQRVLDAVRARGGRLLAADSGGEFFSRYGQPGDVLLNPFDGRSVAWTPFVEIRAEYDCQRIAKSAIPDREGSGGEWNRYGQSLVAEVLLALHRAGDHSTDELLRLLTSAPADELATLLVGTPAAAVVGPGNERMLASVRSIIATYLGAWRYLPDRGDFSIREWTRDEEAAGWLFLTYRDDQLPLLRHLIGGWVDLALVEALTLSENSDRQLWFVFDEADSLGKVGNLDQGLAKLRKYGGRCVVGCQTIAQLRSTYGRDTAQVIAANAANKLLLRAGDHETARYFSDELGEQDVARVAVSEGASTRADEIGPGSTSTSTSVQRTKRAAVLPAELMALPDLSGFLTLAGIPAVIRLALEYRAVPQTRPGFQIEPDAPEADPLLDLVPDPEASAPAG